MSSGLASDEVAEDYKNSLEDLKTNEKSQIHILTVIARENTEHAMAISRVLENHILTTPPAFKLPALYVVDSVVKNVGTPYTLFLGRNLYEIFMKTYTVVDMPTRRKLDEMLRTWKEPVPGSLDTRPVFPAEITRTIENALIKAKISFIQRYQEQQSRASQHGISGQQQPHQQQQHRTPNQYWRPPSAPQSYVTPPVGRPASVARTSDTYNQPLPGTPAPAPAGTVDMASLHRDIEQLILKARADLALKPLDQDTNQRLQALTDLQKILLQQELPQQQLMIIKEQIAQISASVPNNAAPRAPTPSYPAAQATPAPVAAAAAIPSIPPVPTPPHQLPAAVPPITQQSLQALLNSSTLASLLKATNAQRTQTPPPQPLAPAPVVPQAKAPVAPSLTPAAASVATPSAASSLLASLRAKGLLPPLPGAQTSAQTPSLPLMVTGQSSSTPAAPPSSSLLITIDVPLNTSSVKTSRRNFISTLYEDKPDRCTTCGRRFTADQEGKEQKARHLDWHFKTNQRMTDALKRGQSRSWYLDEMDWIKAKNFDDDSGMADEYQNESSTSEYDISNQKSMRKRPFVRAPNEPSLQNAPCPICQEKFESTWSEEIQDWIWQDAVKVGNRIYHATCYEEVSKEGKPGRALPRRSETPESSLGKRKGVEDDGTPASIKVKRELPE